MVIERTFHTGPAHQGYIEPHNCLAHLERRRLTADDLVQHPGRPAGAHQVRELCSASVSRLRVTPTEIGGGFGGKIRVYLEPVALRCCGARPARPVKMMMNRDEVFEGTGPTPGSYIRVKIGAKKDGKLTAAEA